MYLLTASMWVKQLRTWWRHQMETFSALLAICAGNSPVTGEFPSQRSVTRSLMFSLICALNKRLSKQSWGWWFVTPSRPLWRHCNLQSVDIYPQQSTTKRRLCTVRCRYNTFNFLRNPHQRQPIARPLGRDMGCLLWFNTFIIFCLSQCNGVYNIMLYCTAL